MQIGDDFIPFNQITLVTIIFKFIITSRYHDSLAIQPPYVDRCITLQGMLSSYDNVTNIVSNAKDIKKNSKRH